MKSKALSRHSSRPATCSAEPVDSADTGLDAIYQQQILQHNRQPVGFQKPLPHGSGWQQLHASNPLCGDEIVLAVKMHRSASAAAGKPEPILQELGFNGDSCAICTASASLLCQQLQGLSSQRATAMAQQFIAFVLCQQPLTDERLQPLAIFAQLHQLPNRHHCATLAWQALQDLLGSHPQQTGTGT